MTTLTISNARQQQANALQAYLRNVGQATGSLLMALLGGQPRQAEVASTETRAQRRDAKRDLVNLYRLAGQYDSISPALGAELRYMASRAAK